MAKLRQEIPIFTDTAGTLFSADNVIYALVNPGLYSNATFYFEIAGYKQEGTDATFTLTDVTNSRTLATVLATSTQTNVYRAAFSVDVTGESSEFMVRVTCSYSSVAPHIAGARVVILQDAGSGTQITKTQSSFPLHGRNSFASTADTELSKPKYWKYVSANWQAGTTFYAEVVWSGTGNMYTNTFTLQEDDGSYSNWTTKATMVNAEATSTTLKGRRTSFTPTNGRHYRIVAKISNTMESMNIFSARVSGVISGGVTLAECGSHIITDQAVTSITSYRTKYDPAEWDADGGSLSFYHQASSDSGGTTDIKLETTAPVDVSGSTITDVDKNEVSSALTMPGSATNLRTNITSYANMIYGSSLQAIYSWAAIPSTIVKDNFFRSFVWE